MIFLPSSECFHQHSHVPGPLGLGFFTFEASLPDPPNTAFSSNTCFLITAGSSCHYFTLIAVESGMDLFLPGKSWHGKGLLKWAQLSGPLCFYNTESRHQIAGCRQCQSVLEQGFAKLVDGEGGRGHSWCCTGQGQRCTKLPSICYGH